MSEGPELDGLEALAAEHALGVLTGPERAEAESRTARDPVFAAQVDAWRIRLAPLVDEIASVAAPAGLWARIAARLPANDNGAIGRRLRFWRGAAVGGFALAAASLGGVLFLANRPAVVIQPPPAQPGPLLNASLMPNAGGVQPLFVAAYDPQRKALIVTSLVPPGTDPLHVHQLWLIPQDGKPRSLGMVEPGRSAAMPMPQPMAQLVAEGAELAVSVEPPGGSTNPEGPSGPIAAQGRLAPI
ncbi:anti-sigma factor [Phenylobacterium sp. J426]|uniref:anti-sigma factor n=1 Tax=Phenylobacterium sp. J426 TaxID=2898439 RepID=UPI002151A6BB|nr:anti-sigma factor [Phenylobacterium sp. J426]MCR5872827.1 anti-sigma factor [Phenylobacterium sp. J426]